jgi:hypothetical protein
MDETSSNKATDQTGPVENQRPAAPPVVSATSTPAVAPAVPTAGAAAPLLSTKYLAEKLEEAELLLGYAAEVGIKVDGQVRDDVLKARIASDSGGLPEQTAANLLAALTALAVNVRPVTVESLRAWADPDAADVKEIPFLAPIAIVTGCVIVLFSLLTFVSKNISDKITTSIDTANGLAAKLRTELGPAPLSTNPPPIAAIAQTNNSEVSWQDQVWFGPSGIPAGLADKDVVSDLQQFAATMREVDGYGRQLKKWCLFNFAEPHYAQGGTNRAALELSPGLNVRLSQELTDKVAEYQLVRSFGNQIVEKATVYYGAIAISILPVLYALLGAVAYLLRSYEQQSKNRTLVAGEKHIARLLIAGIGGLVVGQFNNVAQGINITPFAVAFLVGYAVDVFFTFLEGLLQMFVKRGPGNS